MLAALGNMLGTVDSAALRVTSAWPAWLSPIGWGQQMRPFADNCGGHSGSPWLAMACPFRDGHRRLPAGVMWAVECGPSAGLPATRARPC